jgi:cephalosporin hydroxylase
MINPTEEYIFERDIQTINNMGDSDLKMATRIMTDNLIRTNYIKSFIWLGRPIMQYPTDLMVMQELIWQLKPDFIIETGIAFGGSTAFYASILELNGKFGTVIAIDKEIREHNLEEIEKHPLRKRMWIIEGSSTAQWVIDEIKSIAACNFKIMVVLDSDHTEKHVTKELELYSPFVSVDSYLIVCDTAIEEWVEKYPFPDRPWGVGNNPATAVKKFMANRDNFVVDEDVENRAVITGHPGGWLRRIR